MFAVAIALIWLGVWCVCEWVVSVVRAGRAVASRQRHNDRVCRLACLCVSEGR